MVINANRLPSGEPGVKGKMFTATFHLEGQEFMGLNGGPNHPHTDAISFFVKCDTQQEVDHYWEKLTADGGQEIQCGWLKDKFGISWQIIPGILGQLLGNPDAAKAQRAMQAMMKMKKLDIAALQAASEG